MKRENDKVAEITLRTAILLTAAAFAGACTPEQPEAGTKAVAPANVGTTEATMPRRPAAEGASVHFITPEDGAIVSSPVRVEFAIVGMELAPAGKDTENSGHHHVLIDTDLPDMTQPIPADAMHVHFGDGAATAELVLAPGEHTLQLLFADYRHLPHDPPVYSGRITITVE
jgi:hypothetical protein